MLSVNMWDCCHTLSDVAVVIWIQQKQHPTKEGADAAAAVLAIPELLEHILLHVRNRDELAQFKKVSQFWEAEAERVEQRVPKKQPVQQIHYIWTHNLIYYSQFGLRPFCFATYYAEESVRKRSVCPS